jgi:hypothetical protein
MRKGNLVKLNKSECFTVENGGQRQWPLSTRERDEKSVIEAFCHLTAQELTDWYNSNESKGINSAGESKLPPTFSLVEIHTKDILVVEKARCRKTFGYSTSGGWTQVLNPKTGQSCFIKRNLLEVVSQ